MRKPKLRNMPPATKSDFGFQVARFVSDHIKSCGITNHRDISMHLNQWNKMWGSPFDDDDIKKIVYEACDGTK